MHRQRRGATCPQRRGDTPVSKRDDIDPKDVKARLLARRAELQAESKSSQEERAPVELDQARIGRLSRMDALQGQAMAIEAERRRGIELKRIDAALQRLEDGSYGACLSCGENIPAERLSSDPMTPLCIDCARAAH